MHPTAASTEPQEWSPRPPTSTQLLPPGSPSPETSSTQDKAAEAALYSDEEEALVVEHLKNLGYL